MLGLGGLGSIEGIAGAAFAGSGAPDALRRSGWLGPGSDEFRVKGAPGDILHLVAVEDLPIAASRPELVGHEDAFRVVFSGPDGLDGEIRTLENPRLGSVTMFISPVGDAQSQEYEAIVDRTVRLPGVDGSGGTGTGGSGPVVEGPGPAVAAGLKLTGARLRRGRGRTLVADVTLSGRPEVVRAALLRRGRAVARTLGTAGGTALKLRFRPRADAESGRYRLRLELVDAAGNESTAGAHVRLR